MVEKMCLSKFYVSPVVQSSEWIHPYSHVVKTTPLHIKKSTHTEKKGMVLNIVMLQLCISYGIARQLFMTGSAKTRHNHAFFKFLFIKYL